MKCLIKIPRMPQKGSAGIDIIQSPKRDLFSLSCTPGPRPSTEDEEWGKKSRPPGPAVWGRASIVAAFPSWTTVSYAGTLFCWIFFWIQCFRQPIPVAWQWNCWPFAVIIIFKSPLGKDRLSRKNFTN